MKAIAAEPGIAGTARLEDIPEPGMRDGSSSRCSTRSGCGGFCRGYWMRTNF